MTGDAVQLGSQVDDLTRRVADYKRRIAAAQQTYGDLLITLHDLEARK